MSVEAAGGAEGTRDLAAAALPGSVVPCPLRSGQAIAMGRCVEYQQQNGCHCEYALVALRVTEKRLAEPPAPITRQERLQLHMRVPSAKEEQQQQQQQQQFLGQVRELIARAEDLEQQRPPALPAKEEAMPRGVRSDGAKCECGKPLGMRAQPGDQCIGCKRKAKANGGGQPVAARSAPRADVVELLQEALAHHRAQAAKIEKALEVLS